MTVQVNSAWEKLWGITWKELDRIKYSIFEDKQVEKLGILKYLNRAYSGETLSTLPIVYNAEESTGTGNKRWVVANIYPIYDDAGVISNVAIIQEDITKSKQSEEALRKSEETFRAIVEHVPVMIDSFNENGECTIWNKEVEKRLGFTISEVNESENALELVYSKEEAQEIIKNISRKDGKFRPFHPVAKNGEIKTQEWADFALPDGRCVSIGVDITDRRLAEEKFKTAFYSNAALMAISTIEEGRFIEVNDKFVETTEYAREDIIGKTSKELNLFVDYSDRANFKEKVETTGKVPHKEIRIRTKSGSIRYGYFSASIVSLDTDKKAMLTVMVDLTETRKMKNALQESEKKYHDLYDNAPDMYVSVDVKTTRIVECNQTLSDATGYTKDEIIGQPIFFLYHPDAIEGAKDAFHEFGTTGKIKDRELILKRKDGSKIDVLLKVTSIKDNEANILHSILSLRDITDLKQAEATIKKKEEELQQTQKMEAIGTLAGGIAHDFNNMLGIIIGNVSYILSNLDKSEELYEVLSDVQESSKQAQSLTQQLLTFSKGGEPVKKIANVNRIIRSAAIFSTRGAKPKCKFEFSNDLWSAEVDEGQINQVIQNLVINANQAMPHGGIINIQTNNSNIETGDITPLPEGQYINISIEDRGIGISKENLLNIFEPYFTTKQKGSGLGLATTYSIVKKHGGHITVYSELGKGTVFNIYLPASLSESEIYEEPEGIKHAGQGKILVMDDQEPLLQMVRRMLNSMGYEDIVCVTDGSYAIETYQESLDSGNPFDIVILDLTVPGGMGGLRTIIELLKIDPKVKAIVSSGYSSDPIMSNYEDYGFCGVVPKPYPKSQLSEVLNMIFSEKG